MRLQTVEHNLATKQQQQGKNKVFINIRVKKESVALGFQLQRSQALGGSVVTGHQHVEGPGCAGCDVSSQLVHITRQATYTPVSSVETKTLGDNPIKTFHLLMLFGKLTTRWKGGTSWGQLCSKHAPCARGLASCVASCPGEVPSHLHAFM